MIESALARRLEAIAPFHVMELAKRAERLARSGRSIINLGIGEPDFTAAPDVLEAAERAMRDGRMQYTPATGLPELRHAISDWYAKRFGASVDPDRIIITSGASGALILACAALVERDAEVLMPDPSYPCNRHFVSAFEGVPRMVPCGPEQRFQLSADDVTRHWTPATRGVLLASPSNPTGTSILPDELARIVDAVRARGGFTLVDEIYQGLAYEHEPRTALSLGEDVIVVNSFSKYFHMTGWRLGWIVVPPARLPDFEKLAQNFFICASALAQHAAMGCFTTDSLELYEERRNEFRRRRDFLVPALEDMGLSVPVVPDGAFYVYADCRRHGEDADALTLEMLDSAGVALVPGMDFGPFTARSHLRISYATSMENLHAAVARMRNFLLARGTQG